MAATTRVTIDGNVNGRILNIVGAGTDVRLRQVTLSMASSVTRRMAVPSCSAEAA